VRYFAVSGEDDNLHARTQADRWACVVAGKVRSHEAVLDILDTAREEQGLRAGEGVFSAADLSGHEVIDIFLPLTSGGRLVLATKAELRDPDRLEAAIHAANCKFVRPPKVMALSMGAGSGGRANSMPASAS
jgi:non-ribosomal peptide synthetase component F